MRILQWNLNGFYMRRESLQVMLKSFTPEVVCLQETNFKRTHCAKLRGYTNYLKNRTNAAHASGGVAIYVQNNIPSKEIQIVSHLEIVVVTVSIPHKTTICNIYLPNNYPININELEGLTQQLPRPFIIVGDFNGHNPLWGSSRIDKRGKILERWLTDPEYVLLNTGSPTHFTCASGTFSALDLSICNANISHNLEWVVDDYLHDSDHFPIHIIIPDGKRTASTPSPTVKWKLKNADWSSYKREITKFISEMPSRVSWPNTEIDLLIEAFTSVITKAADAAIPTCAIKRKINEVPWWNAECELTTKEAKHAFYTYKRHQTTQNKIQYKKLKAAARRKLKDSKKDAWIKFVRSLNRHTPSNQVWRAIKNIQGLKHQSTIAFLMDDNGHIIQDATSISNTLAETFASNSSDNNYDHNFKQRKDNAEKDMIERIRSCK